MKTRLLSALGYEADASLGAVLLDKLGDLIISELEAVVLTIVVCIIAAIVFLSFGLGIHPNIRWIVVIWQMLAVYRMYQNWYL